MKLFYCYVPVLAFLFYGAQSVWAADLDSTDLSKSDSGALLSHEDLIRDLGAEESVRYQIKANLTLANQSDSSSNDQIEELLRHPVICIGTGHNTSKLGFSHGSQTRVRSKDVSIDFKGGRLGSTFSADGFKIWHFANRLKSETYGSVFFAHAGAKGIPIDSDKLGPSLALYFNALKPGGFFVFNSEVHNNIKECGRKLASHYQKADFNKLLQAWEEAFARLGFINISITIKDESDGYGEDMFSFLLVGQKPE